MKKRRLLNRKGYFFIIDSIIALGVLAIGVFLVSNLYIDVPSKDEPAILSEDIMDFFANNKIKDTDNPYVGLSGTLWSEEGEATGLCPGESLTANAENTLLQQIAYFYEKSVDNSCYLDIIEKLIISLTKNILPPQYTFEVLIHDTIGGTTTRLYPKNPSQGHLDSKESTRVLIPSKKIVYGINQETGEIFGPYAAEVLIWQ